MGHQLQLQDRQIVALAQCRDLGLLGLTDDVPMGAHNRADSCIGQRLILVRLPAEQARYCGKRQLLRQ